jgi:cell division protein FtsB
MDARNREANGSGREVLPEQAVENMALAGVAALRRLIADRDNFRNRLNAREREFAKLRAAKEELTRNLNMVRALASTQEREMRSLRASNEELRGNLNRLRDQYVGLVNKFLAQLRQIDHSIRHAVHRPDDDDTVVSFAQNFPQQNGHVAEKAEWRQQHAHGY